MLVRSLPIVISKRAERTFQGVLLREASMRHRMNRPSHGKPLADHCNKMATRPCLRRAQPCLPRSMSRPAKKGAIALDSEAALHLRTGQIPPLHGASCDRPPIMVGVNLAAGNRLSHHQRSEIACACIGVPGRASAAGPAMARQLRRIDRG